MRVCACGCGGSLEGRSERAKYVNAACRARGWKMATDYQHPRNVSENARNARLGRRTRNPDMRISYRKAVDLFADTLTINGIAPEHEARLMAEMTFRQILGPAAREHLDKAA